MVALAFEYNSKRLISSLFVKTEYNTSQINLLSIAQQLYKKSFIKCQHLYHFEQTHPLPNYQLKSWEPLSINYKFYSL